ncbi:MULTISPECIES: FAD-dependent monooxygenase [unclassified Nocardia]|uniref:FAD-dependent monooxygenase n=1 Tax=unclassified Nocardia TaxID=2637762 RepID=UPI001CE4356E|nr:MULTISPECIES: FAD-dependent monooxygenase [unclassified Nocardia]
MTTTERVPVLVVGGGLVGISTALFLEYHGIPYLLVERRNSVSALPRARGVHTRTSEMFRQVGVERQVEQVSAAVVKAGSFGGASRGATLTTATQLDLGHLRHGVTGGVASPSKFCFAPQVLLEPALVETARARGGDLRFGTELIEFDADTAGVTARVRDDKGERVIRADYLIAADGASSPVRQALGIGGWTVPPTEHYINTFARVDLTAVLGGKTFSQCEIRNDTVRCLVLAKNNTDEWSFHLEYDPDRESIADYPDTRCVELIRAAVGIPDIPVEVLGKAAWDTGVFVADEYRRGRIFLVGDAAHRFAPWGGFGVNTGIADAHNLVWKLAAVLSGVAEDALLESYQTERRPRAVVAVEQTMRNVDFDARYGIRTADNAEAFVGKLDFGTVMMKYRYESTALFGGESAGNVPELTGQVGTRVPHMWIDADEQVSTVDLPGPGFSLLIAGTSARWRDAAAKAQRDTGIDITVDALPAAEWSACTGLSEGGALLVRPDMHVAARSDAGLDPASLTEVVRRITGQVVAADYAESA